MKLNQDSNRSKIIMFAAQSYMGMGGNPVELFKESAEWLYDCYEKTGDEICLKAAVQIVKVYMEFGLAYKSGESLFQKILEAAGTTVEEEFPKRLYPSNVLKPKVSPIRDALGYWPKTSEDSMNVDEVVKDILEKLQKQEHGCYLYGKKRGEVGYELLILEENSYLVDFQKHKVFQFIV